MGSAMDEDLRGLLTYYGETPDSPEAPKPEDFFGMILSFSSSLQVRPVPYLLSRLCSQLCLSEMCAGSRGCSSEDRGQ